MDPIRNPYAPGAGAQPPELAGRDELLRDIPISLERIRQGRSAKSVLMVGLRGVGKTVLLNRLRKESVRSGHRTLAIEAPEGRSLPGLLAPELRVALLELSTVERTRALARRALSALAGFAQALRVKYEDIEVGFDVERQSGLADNGDLQHDLQALLEVAGEAAKAGDTALIMFIDELQYVKEDELAALITALHRVAQRTLPVAVVGAGLPQLTGRMGKAKSYAERLFDFRDIGPLSQEAAFQALAKPAEAEGVSYQQDALTRIFSTTKGYPYFLQEWGKHVWDVAQMSPITSNDVEVATKITLAALDQSFFRVRFDRMTPAEKRYLRAMAELGPGPHRSGEIASELRRTGQSLGPLRSSLITKGMVWSPHHGDTAFTVPLFDEFMKRTMPDSSWRVSE